MTNKELSLSIRVLVTELARCHQVIEAQRADLASWKREARKWERRAKNKQQNNRTENR